MKILVIATYLPPYIGSGNIRVLNYINYLSRLKNNIDVIGVDYPKDAIAYDKNLENVFDDEINIYRLNPGFIYRIFNRKKTVKTNEKIDNQSQINLLNRIKYKLNKFIKLNFLIPDSFIFWIKPAYKKGCELIKKNNYDLILSIHETPSSHIVAYKLKRKFNVKWIGYWSDPWCGDSALRCNGAFLKNKIEEKIEKKIVLGMDKLLFTTNGTLQSYVKKYNIDEKNVDIVYRGYDPQMYNEIDNQEFDSKYFKKNKINIVHTGTIYNKLRDIQPLYESLEKIRGNNSEVFNKLNILFIGQFTEEKDKELLESIECIKILPLMPFFESIKFVVHADILLLYGNKNSTQVPGKLYEYIGSKATVITILGSENDESGIIMKKINKGPIINNTVKELNNLLLNIDEILYNEKNLIWRNPNLEFTWENIVNDLENKLKC
ncbi:hypothetical protein EXM65_09440 [Clostridium botulinum]|uniref:Glycosyltransferase family 4 protein n=1 Tax=Clostridium botulinum TaxID=1491 RepID=A0A6M0SPX0_CLOBO|nr:hypothetical protein [Clostridium botulinum]